MAKNLQVDNELGSVGQFVRDEDGNSSALALSTAGKVGIGTSNPARNLEIKDPAEGVVAIKKTGSGTANDPFARIDLGLDAGGLNEYAARILAVSETNGYVDQGKAHLVSGQLQFQTMRAASNLGADEASPTTKLTITGAGDVGIGTSRPARNLEIEDPTEGVVAITKTGSGTANDSFARIDFGLDAGGLNEYAARILAVSETNGYVDKGKAHLVSGQLQFQTMRAASGLGADEATPTTKLTITGAGDVGIGTTEPNEKLHVGGNSQIDGTTQTSALEITGTDERVPAINVSERVQVHRDSHEAGLVETFGPNGRTNFLLSSEAFSDGNLGALGLFDADGEMTVLAGASSGGLLRGVAVFEKEDFYARAEMFVDGDDDISYISVGADGRARAIMKHDADDDISYIEADVKSFRVQNSKQPDTDIVYVCIEGPEAAVYVRGTARLANGKAVVTLPDHFTSVASGKDTTVQVTPLSAQSLGLAVVEKHPTHFVTKELQDGTGTYDFDWEVKSVRKGYEDYQVIRPGRERVHQKLSLTRQPGS